MTDASVDWAEQVNYWKSRSQELELRLNDLREEFDEFTTSSKDLESELEAQLSQSDRRNKELSQRLEKVNQESESLKRQLNSKNEDINKLQEECNSLRKVTDERNRLLRQTEQLNDDLERKTRITLTSLAEFEKGLNEAIEKNVFLQSEKEELMEAAQRWRDESRDLHHELAVQRTRVSFPPDTNRSEYCTSPQSRSYHFEKDLSHSNSSTHIDAHTQTESSSHTSHSTGRSSIPSSRSMGFTDNQFSNGLVTSGLNSSPATDGSNQSMSPALRISALNAVGNLMRTVGALESRLAFIMNSQYQYHNNNNNINNHQHQQKQQQSTSSDMKCSTTSRQPVPGHVASSYQHIGGRDQTPSGIPPPRIMSNPRTAVAAVNRRSTIISSGQSFT